MNDIITDIFTATRALYPQARISETPMPITDRERELFDALSEVMEWISNWSPNFEQDDEWSATRAKVDAALAKARGEL